MVPVGEIPGLTMEMYLALPAVNASLLKTILTHCPRAAWHESWLNPHRPASDDTKATDIGSISHGILLEGSEDGIVVIDPNDHPAERTGAIPDGWTNKSIRAARDHVRGLGKIPVLKDDADGIRAMVAEARRFLDDDVRSQEPEIWAMFQPGGGDSELTMLWNEGETQCRIRHDRIAKNRRIIADYKTTQTTSEPDAWGRTQMVRMGFYTSAAFYLRGVKALCRVIPAYVWLVQDQNPPFLCSLVGLDPHAAELGAAKVEMALNIWRSCERSGKWPGYSGRVVYPEIPAYEDSAFEEKQIAGFEYDPAALFGEKT